MKNEMSIKRAAAINGAASYACVILQLAFNGVLARILTPDDYGIVAVVTVFTTFFTVVSNMGIGPAVIQDKTLTDDEVSDIFAFNFYVAVFTAALFIALAYPISLFYGDRVYVPICFLLSISLFFHTINVVPHALLLKDKRFLLIGLRMVAVTVASYGAAIIIALMGYKYYALVWQAIAFAAVSFFWNYATTRIKLKLKFRFSSIKKVFSFSVFQMAYSIINYFSKNIDNLVIGKFLGNSELGYYDKAYKVTLYPQNNLTNVITPTLHPILSANQNNKPYIYERYMNVVKVLSLLGLFIAIYCHFASYEVINILFGSNWGASVPCIAWLSLSIWSQVVTASSQAIFQSAGNPKNMFIASIFTVILTAGAIILGVLTHSIVNISLYLMIAFNLNFFVTYFILVKYTLGMSYTGFLKSFIPDLMIAIIVFAAGFGSTFIHVSNPLFSAVIKGCVMGAAYMLGIIALKQHKILLQMLKSKTKKS